MKLKTGDKAPEFEELLSAKEKYVILYFYPRDNTPGCTREACGFRDELPNFSKKDAVVIGVSRDSQEKHEAFKSEHKLPFQLLSDPELILHKAYGAYGEKTLYGKKSMGVIRSTFLINKDLKILKAWYNVKVDGHVQKVLDTLE